jgi:hypothetical protein
MARPSAETPVQNRNHQRHMVSAAKHTTSSSQYAPRCMHVCITGVHLSCMVQNSTYKSRESAAGAAAAAVARTAKLRAVQTLGHHHREWILTQSFCGKDSLMYLCSFSQPPLADHELLQRIGIEMLPMSVHDVGYCTALHQAAVNSHAAAVADGRNWQIAALTPLSYHLPPALLVPEHLNAIGKHSTQHGELCVRSQPICARCSCSLFGGFCLHLCQK